MAGGEGRRPQAGQLRRSDFSDHDGHREIGQRRCGSDRGAVRDADVECGARDGGARYAAELGRTEPIIFYAASREWADKNADAIKKFRAAIAEAAPIVNNDREKASASISKFTKQPIELVKATLPNQSEPVLKPEQLAWWIDIMSSQKMLQTKVDLNKLMLN